ncbi:MAG: hypothetical protein AAF921_26385, partial [Cyanobacteria bacterium P01_D01_bin.44]
MKPIRILRPFSQPVWRLSLTLLLTVSVPFGLLLASKASSPNAWDAFRQDVQTEMELAVAERFQTYQIEIDPYGTESYGIAIATGQSATDGSQLLIVGVYDKRSQHLEISEFPV